jgi:hypothetical protein
MSPRRKETKHPNYITDKDPLTKFRLCQLCEEKLSARFLNERGGRRCLPSDMMAPMIQQWNVNID